MRSIVTRLHDLVSALKTALSLTSTKALRFEPLEDLRAMQDNPATPPLLQKLDAYWRAANYISVGQIYLYDNPLLTRPLTLADVKHMLLGHWGTTPGQNFI